MKKLLTAAALASALLLSAPAAFAENWVEVAGYQGLPNKMIARRLDITESTVKVHVKHMLKKMKLKSRVEAAVWVHQERIF